MSVNKSEQPCDALGLLKYFESFEIDSFYKECINVKLACHVLWTTDSITEVVDSINIGNVVEEGFDTLEHRLTGYCLNRGLQADALKLYRRSEPGCNFAIFVVEVPGGTYQLNFVEINY